MANRRPAGDGMVRQKKRGQWEGRIVVGHKSDGKPIYRYVYGKTQKETLEKLHQRIEDYRGVELTEDSKMTLGEWLDRWMNEYMIFTIRESTWDSYASLIRMHVKPHLGDKPVAFVTTADVQRMYNKIKKNGRQEAHPLRGHELADSTVRSIHMMLHEAMDAAVKERLIVKNPTDGTTIPKNNYAPKQILTEAQLEKFMRVVMQDEVWRDFFYTELTTGLRLGEICGLRWSDYDEATGRLKISRTVKKKKGGGVTWGDTKTETGTRNILLPPSTAEVLRERKKTAMSEWIFPNIYRPDEAMHPEHPYNRMKTLLKQAELPLIRFHDLRHTFATHALTGGVDAKTLSRILGHTNASFTLDTYTHVTTDMQKRASNIVGGFMEDLIIKECIRPLTQSNYENRIYDHIIPEIGKIPLNKLTQTDLQQFYARLKRNGRKQYVEKYGPGLSDRMVRACHASCRMALEKAVAEGLIRVNPAIGCKLPPKKAREMQVLTKDELQRFLAQAKEDGYYELFLLELGTGMRRGELMGLQWGDLNFDTGELHIVRQACAVKGKIEISVPKTKSSIRTVVLPPSLVEVLRKYKETTNSRWMFPSPNDPNVPRYPTSIGEILSFLLKRAGCKHVRFHDLRHTFATMALENGMDVKTLSATIGHVSAATTLDIYSHVTDTMQMQAAVSIDRKIGKTDARMPVIEQTPDETAKPPVNATCAPTEPHLEPIPRKIRKSGTGCLYQINDNLWEGSFFPRLPGGKRKKFNVYAETKEQCENKLAEMIERVKAEIAEEKAKLKEGAE